ncbi:MAG: hypothetical protein KZQ73_08775 [Candidatus Thiodiazotropha sp. (ex Semelilucina semeliformis)]|nr:hypothetical protein [Candidatus Thiodiazotropha sp. (ex Semelilucina semeliformis)]MCU7828721.1 hypothetical protein [Candidatus Thiodiazotropha sp. (ex Myrtea sp. 'scaly one' KF741663)]
MTSEKLIDKFHTLLNMERRKQKEKRDKIRTLLKKLKKQQMVLKGKLEKEQSADDRKRTKRNLKVIQAQRKKGIKLCKSIKCK